MYILWQHRASVPLVEGSTTKSVDGLVAGAALPRPIHLFPLVCRHRYRLNHHGTYESVADESDAEHLGTVKVIARQQCAGRGSLNGIASAIGSPVSRMEHAFYI